MHLKGSGHAEDAAGPRPDAARQPSAYLADFPRASRKSAFMRRSVAEIGATAVTTRRNAAAEACILSHPSYMMEL
jgi:hypothetical protein